jgi:hypothetical protein
MNSTLMISNKVEEKLLLVEPSDDWSPEDEYAAYDQCLAEVLTKEEGRAWTEGNICIYDYIILIDCLLDAASEMTPELAVFIGRHAGYCRQLLRQRVRKTFHHFGNFH